MNEITIKRETGEYDEIHLLWYRCQSCGNTLVAYGSNYCSECGAAINWTGELVQEMQWPEDVNKSV